MNKEGIGEVGRIIRGMIDEQMQAVIDAQMRTAMYSGNSATQMNVDQSREISFVDKAMARKAVKGRDGVWRYE